MNVLKFGYGIVLDDLPDIPEFLFFYVVFIFQKSLNVWKDIHVCLEAKHIGTHLMDQLKNKCVI